VFSIASAFAIGEQLGALALDDGTDFPGPLGRIEDAQGAIDRIEVVAERLCAARTSPKSSAQVAANRSRQYRRLCENPDE